MTIPTLMSILSAPGSSAAAPSAVSGAELPGSGEVGFACLMQTLLNQQQAPAVPVSGTDANGEATGVAGAPAGADAQSDEQVGVAASGSVDAGVAEAAGTTLGLPAPSGADQASEATRATQATQVAPATVGAHPSGRAGAVVDTEHSDDDATEVSTAAASAVVAPAPMTPMTPVTTTPSTGAKQPSTGALDAAPGAARGPRTGHRLPGSAAGTVTDGSPGLLGGSPGDALAASSRNGDTTTASQPAATATATTLQPADPGQTQGAAAVSVVAPSSGIPHTAAGQAPVATQVAGQVFPEVVRLVTRGDGTQRMTLRLSPEDLGEVRIVLTVRHGSVDVSLAAGAEAQDALRHGSAELRRLLENVGATSAQIVVRDLPGSPNSVSPSAAAQPAGMGAAATHADSNGGHAHDHQRGGDATGQQPGHHQTSGPAHIDVRPQPARSTAHAAAAGVDLRL